MSDIANFFEHEIALAVLKLMDLDTYEIFFNALLYGRSVEGNNQDPEITSTIT